MNNKLPKVIHQELNPASVGGKPSTRAMLVLKPERPCQHGKCSFCAFRELPKEEGIAFPKALKAAAGAGRIELLVAGSMLDERQVRMGAVEKMLRMVAGTDAKAALIESRPEFITPKKIRALKAALAGKELEIAIGLETADDLLRERLGKGFTFQDFNRAATIIADCGAKPVAYLLAKPPGLTEEGAVSDVLNSVVMLHLFKHDFEARIALEPFFPILGMAAYEPLRSKTLAQLIVRMRALNPEAEIFVGLSNEGLSAAHPISNGAVPRELFEQFNATQNVEIFNEVI